MPKYAEVAQDIIVCGLDCGWKNSMNSAAIHIFIFWKFVHPKDHPEAAVWKTGSQDAGSSDERAQSSFWRNR